MWFEQGMFWAALGMAWVLAIAVILIVVWNLRSKQRLERMAMVHEERLKAIEKGTPLPEFPGLDEEAEIARRYPVLRANPRWPLGAGAVFVMSGVGYIVAMLLAADMGLSQLWSFGMIGIFFGMGLVFYYYLTRDSES